MEFDKGVNQLLFPCFGETVDTFVMIVTTVSP